MGEGEGLVSDGDAALVGLGGALVGLGGCDGAGQPSSLWIRLIWSWRS